MGDHFAPRILDEKYFVHLLLGCRQNYEQLMNIEEKITEREERQKILGARKTLEFFIYSSKH